MKILVFDKKGGAEKFGPAKRFNWSVMAFPVKGKTMRKLISTIPKNGREEIRVALDEFQTKDASYDMVSMRVFFEDGGEYRPGRNGLNVRVELLPAILAALREAETEARAAGLLGGEDERQAA